MESENCQMPEGKMLQHLGNLRKMIVHNHELDNLSEFVLHELCAGPCFSINKAAYFINNPDFKMLRGVTGYSKQESHMPDAWNNQKQFADNMQNSTFNQKVREYSQNSFDKGSRSKKYMIDKLADQLEIDNPEYHVWNLKHANHGLLIYDPSKDEANHLQEHLHDSLHYLGFCPVS